MEKLGLIEMTDIKIEVGRLFSTGISHDEALKQVSQSVDNIAFTQTWDEYEHMYMASLSFLVKKN